MTSFKPSVTPEELAKGMADMQEVHKINLEAKARMTENPYTGKWAPLFAKLYQDIYGAVFLIRKEFEDGFQLSDLDDVLIVGTPALVKIHGAVQAEGIADTELESFMTDLVQFTYYELDDLIKWGWLKWVLKLVFKFYAAKKLGKLLADLVRYIDGKLDATDVDERIVSIYQGVRNWLNGAEI